MSESYVECLVQGRQNTKMKALMIFLIVIEVLGFIAMLLFGKWWIFILLIGGGVGIYISSRYIGVEYEYLYIDKELVIDKIYNQERRKRIATYSFDKVQVIAPVKSYHLDNFGKLSDRAKDYGAADDQAGKYVMFYEGQEQVLFSPNEALVKIMKNAAPRKVYSE